MKDIILKLYLIIDSHCNFFLSWITTNVVSSNAVQAKYTRFNIMW